ncbi:hypothetical protein DPMN_159403 [Dreissena polymorpha]|uniref:Uncharacterized protein n=1 Tax=Dreissena polymorpha TaxID=45954 RepID=A0A9D4EJQ9_DREPO|nr:hypothetical protein DPMN_159403 [Dreissena polymorpha]
MFKVGRKLGVTLDSICEERCSIEALPTINVAKRGEKWVTADNRRLWVLKELERLGKCDSVPVIVRSDIPSKKLTSKNGGVSVNVRGPPGGEWYKKPCAGRSHYTIVPSRSNDPGWDDTDADYDFFTNFIKGTL